MRYVFSFGPIIAVIFVASYAFDYLKTAEQQKTEQETQRTLQVIVQKEGVAAAERFEQARCKN